MAFLHSLINTRLVICVVIAFVIGVITESSLYLYAEKEIPQTKIANGFLGTHTIKILYCYSCGYRNKYDEYANAIMMKYPLLTVEGANYDPPGLTMLLARIIGVAKIVIILTILSNFNVFEYLGYGTPNIWLWCQTNKMYACLMSFFLPNLIEANLMSSGAFEIYIDDMPVWSKLATGRIPQPAELFQIIDSNLQFADFDRTVEFKPGFPK